MKTAEPQNVTQEELKELVQERVAEQEAVLREQVEEEFTEEVQDAVHEELLAAEPDIRERVAEEFLDRKHQRFNELCDEARTEAYADLYAEGYGLSESR